MNSSYDQLETFEYVLKNILSVPERGLTPGKELKLINDIKTTLLDVLCAFSPDLPIQYASQFESYANTMRKNTPFLEYREGLLGFWNVYKIQTLDLIGKMDEKSKRYGIEQEDTINEHTAIKQKISSYYRTVESIYDSMKERGIENVNLTLLDGLSKTFLENASQPVEWFNKNKQEE